MPPLKTVIIGIGNPDHGDDGVGPAVAHLLQKRNRTSALIIDAGIVPENFLGPVISALPARVLLIDACDFNGAPGDFRLFNRSELQHLTVRGFSTHTPPLNLLANFIYAETGAEIWLLGIMPGQTARPGLSPAVTAALPRLASFIESWTETG
ncbi:MAG: hydrogenase 3 maturation endopeptidase HyCI [candidate division WOR-3 bacterium]